MSDFVDNKLIFSWKEYHSLIDQLVLNVYQSGWKFDQIVCLARGGMRVGDIFSRVYNLPLGILATSSYREDAGTVQGNLDIAKYITMTSGSELKGRVLLLDDMVDTGLTFEGVRQHLLKQYPEITEIRTAVLWWKDHSDIAPDYYVQKLANNPWIHQPFEDYDGIRPHALDAWISRGQKES